MLGVAAALLSVGAVGVSPVQKVIELLDDLEGKVANDLANEEAAMEEYSKFCDRESSDRNYAIETATKAIERLTASVTDASAQLEADEAEIAKLSSDIAHKEKELSKAMKLREAEHATFEHTEENLENADDELHRAENLIKQQMSFAQVEGRSQPRRFTEKQIISQALEKVIDAPWVNSKSKHALQGSL